MRTVSKRQWAEKTKRFILSGAMCLTGVFIICGTAHALEVSFVDPASVPSQNNIKEAFQTADKVNVGITFDIENEIDLNGRTVTLNFQKVEGVNTPCINFKASGKFISGDIAVTITEPDKWNLSEDTKTAVVQYVNPYNRPYKVNTSESKIIRMNLNSLSGDKKYSFIEYTASTDNEFQPIDKIYLKRLVSGDSPVSGDTPQGGVNDGGGCNTGYIQTALILLAGIPFAGKKHR